MTRIVMKLAWCMMVKCRAGSLAAGKSVTPNAGLFCLYTRSLLPLRKVSDPQRRSVCLV